MESFYQRTTTIFQEAKPKLRKLEKMKVQNFVRIKVKYVTNLTN